MRIARRPVAPFFSWAAGLRWTQALLADPSCVAVLVCPQPLSVGRRRRWLHSSRRLSTSDPRPSGIASLKLTQPVPINAASPGRQKTGNSSRTAGASRDGASNLEHYQRPPKNKHGAAVAPLFLILNRPCLKPLSLRRQTRTTCDDKLKCFWGRCLPFALTCYPDGT